jgi:hypothetical protein
LGHRFLGGDAPVDDVLDDLNRSPKSPTLASLREMRYTLSIEARAETATSLPTWRVYSADSAPDLRAGISACGGCALR